MGLLKRKWLVDNTPKILKEMEYYRDYNSFMSLERSVLWDRKNEVEGMNIETAR